MTAAIDMKDMRKLNDRALVTLIKTSRDKKGLQAAKETLWERYEPQRCKYWWSLCKLLNNSSLILEKKDDYMQDSYISFSKALDAVKIDVIRDDKWKFLGYNRFYLMNLRTAYLKKIIEISQHEKSIASRASKDGVSEGAGLESVNLEANQHADSEYASLYSRDYNPETALLDKETEKAFNQAVAICMKKWNPVDVALFSLLKKHRSKSYICKKFSITDEELSRASDRLRKDVQEEMNR